MSLALHAHPTTPSAAPLRLMAEAALSQAGRLALTYRVEGDPRVIAVPPPGPPERQDGLWRSTCFEAFLRAPPAEAYAEINLSPSRAFAVYLFDGYRTGMRPAMAVAAPRIDCEVGGAALRLHAEVDIAPLSIGAARTPLLVGLCAVIEEAGGRLSYWALHHAKERPDFHAAESFVHKLSVS